MVKQPEIKRTAAILSVSPLDADHLSLESIIGDSSVTLLTAHDLASARVLLQEHDVAAIVCERDLSPGTWMYMLEDIQAMPNPPSLIVASRLADERMWVETLNLGAWDLVAKPFDSSEVIRTIKSGSQRWNDQDAPQITRIEHERAATAA
jgi:DNA-binding response OmpR family regulator